MVHTIIYQIKQKGNHQVFIEKDRSIIFRDVGICKEKKTKKKFKYLNPQHLSIFCLDVTNRFLQTIFTVKFL